MMPAGRSRCCSSAVSMSFQIAAYPAVCAGQQGVCDVADAAFHGSMGFRGGSGTLNPLAPEIGRNLAANEVAVPGVLNPDSSSRNQRVRIKEIDPLPVLRSRCSPDD